MIKHLCYLRVFLLRNQRKRSPKFPAPGICFYLQWFLLFTLCSFAMAQTPLQKEHVPFPPDIQRIKDRGALIVGMYHQDRPPFFYVNQQNELAGIDVDMARDIADHLKVNAVFNRDAVSFDGVVDMVAKGQADIAISKLSITMDRALRVAYTQPYVVFNYALLVNRLHLAHLRKTTKDQPTLEMLQSTPMRLGIRGPSSWNKYAIRFFPKAEAITMENLSELVDFTVKGEVEAVLYDAFEMKSIMRNSPELSIYLQLVVLDDHYDPIGIAISPNDHHLLNWLNLYLQTSLIHPELEKLRREYGARKIK